METSRCSEEPGVQVMDRGTNGFSSIGAVTVVGAALGWDARLLDGFGYEQLNLLLGIYSDSLRYPDRSRGKYPVLESQHPDYALILFPVGDAPAVDYTSLATVISDIVYHLGRLGLERGLGSSLRCRSGS